MRASWWCNIRVYIDGAHRDEEWLVVLQRSKLSVRRTVMMLTIRSRNRDNGPRRGRVDCTHVVARGARFHEKSLYGRCYGTTAAGPRSKRFFFFFFFFSGNAKGWKRQFLSLLVDIHIFAYGCIKGCVIGNWM